MNDSSDAQRKDREKGKHKPDQFAPYRPGGSPRPAKGIDAERPDKKPAGPGWRVEGAPSAPKP